MDHLKCKQPSNRFPISLSSFAQRRHRGQLNIQGSSESNGQTLVACGVMVKSAEYVCCSKIKLVSSSYILSHPSGESVQLEPKLVQTYSGSADYE